MLITQTININTKLDCIPVYRNWLNHLRSFERQKFSYHMTATITLAVLNPGVLLLILTNIESLISLYYEMRFTIDIHNSKSVSLSLLLPDWYIAESSSVLSKLYFCGGFDTDRLSSCGAGLLAEGRFN